jgi:phospholipase C
VRCPNVSPWRRAVVGDLTAAFDWAAPDFSWPDLPGTQGNVNASAWQCAHLPPPKLPLFQKMPVQEAGSRVLRPLPYLLHVTAAAAAAGSIQLTFQSQGTQGAVFQVYNLADPSLPPRKYTVGAGAALQDEWSVSAEVGGGVGYSVAAYGPNGFVRKFSGRWASPPPSIPPLSPAPPPAPFSANRLSPMSCLTLQQLRRCVYVRRRHRVPPRQQLQFVSPAPASNPLNP